MNELDIEIEDAFLTICEQTNAGATTPEVEDLLRSRGLNVPFLTITRCLDALESEWPIRGAGDTYENRGNFPIRLPKGHPYGYKTALSKYTDMGQYDEYVKKEMRQKWLNADSRKMRDRIRLG